MPAFLALAASDLKGQATAERWALTPELRIGSVNSADYALSSVSDIVVDRDGSIYVGQRTEFTVRVFNADGRFLRTIGREGGGPGEFRSLGRIGLVGDTLWAHDPVLYRQTFFSRTGEPLDVVIVNGPMIPEVSTRPTSPQFYSPDGTFLAQPYTSSRDDLQFFPLVRMDRAGALVELIGAVRYEPPMRVRGNLDGRQMIGMMMRPISSAGLWQPSPIDGSVIIVDRPIATSESPATFRIQRFQAAGIPMFERDFTYTPRRIPEAGVESILNRMEDVGDARLPPEMFQQYRDQLGPLEFDSPVSQLLVGRDGTIWLRREELGLQEVEWLVLDEVGSPIGAFVMPANVRLLEADRDHVWGVETDALDVPYVVRYRVERR